MTNNSKSTNAKPMPLKGIRIVEFGVFISAPGASSILGDLGADVVKIESLTGDPARHEVRLGRITLSLKDGDNILHKIFNRNKKGICIDIEKEKGREILHRLIKDADVFLTNLRKNTKTKLGIDYPNIYKVNPRIIYASASGYGPEGPMSNVGAMDPLGLSYSGMMFMTGHPEPILIPGAVLDQATAIGVSHAILTALFVRERQGIGQEIHISLYGTGMWLMYFNLMLANILSISPSDQLFNRYETSPLRNYSRCKDGKWIMGIHHPEEKYWPAFCEATGQTALLHDPRFADEVTKRANCAELVAIFDKVFATKTRDEWVEILTQKGLMFCPVQDVKEIQNDPQALINNYIVDFEDPRLGKVKVPGYPIHFSANRAGTTSFAPTIGEHTDLIMRQMGYTDQEIRELKEEGVIK